MKIPPSIKTLLGFARKGNYLISGEAALEAGLKRRQVSLVLIAEDMPDKRQKNWIKWCQDLQLPYAVLGDKEEFGQTLGMSPRGIIGIKDSKMAEAILKKLALEEQGLPETNGGD
ncbi:MAG: ribosomal L7Ae/L30e/S12e/Gadd45 family protein [Peptococcia bacterium]